MKVLIKREEAGPFEVSVKTEEPGPSESVDNKTGLSTVFKDPNFKVCIYFWYRSLLVR